MYHSNPSFLIKALEVVELLVVLADAPNPDAVLRVLALGEGVIEANALLAGPKFAIPCHGGAISVCRSDLHSFRAQD